MHGHGFFSYESQKQKRRRQLMPFATVCFMTALIKYLQY